MNRRMALIELADGLFDVSGHADCLVTGMTADSRALQPGDAFIAVQGLTAHGLSYLRTEQAVKASVVLYEVPAPASTFIPENAIAVPALKSLQGRIANRFFGAPSEAMAMVGVTGTNGKTSTVQLIAQAFTLQGRTAGTIGTLGTGLYGRLQSGERTTPDVIAVHRALAEMHDAGAEAVAMEVSSHALDQERVAAVAFDTAVFSNLTLDHLDYHGSMQAYFEAKAKLFDWPGLRHAVINIDDAYGRVLADKLPAGLYCIRTSSQGADADLRVEALTLGLEGMHFMLVHGAERAAVASPLLGRFNADNLLAVAGVLLADGMGLNDVAALLGRLGPVDGRMSRLGGMHGKPLVVVDYAHTPDALEQALKTLRGHSQARLICVFGCGGDRDRSKRPLMAASAEQWADAVWVTDDNPRTESGDAIVAEIRTGFRHPEAVRIQRDRRAAIAEAIAAAGPQDIVLIAGKGHETYQEVDGVKAPFDDRAIAAVYLQEAA
ncbi:MAG: UDP-N-acetylmuramoyl-L-alanyl-D-glutamate--2,6-diaminopimelate ligase [Arenimonas sp.]|uniref:UDP-N-acetylmuramoyl-L-alanyl-D-glutamate--2, 6-diaminopimelate ligase n=1 Tax=Arenimonas sp. TaxID=1872635 RepID=UPI003C11BBC2